MPPNQAEKAVANALGGLKSATRQETCPYCFNLFRLAETPFRCSARPAKCAQAPDAVLGREWMDASPVGRVIPAARDFRREATCTDCATVSLLRLCPHCHQQLPFGFADLENYVFAVLGARMSGKSHYVTSAVETFRHSRGPQLGLTIQPADDRSQARYEQNFRRPLYEFNRTLDGTRTAEADAQNALPLVFSAKLTRKDWRGNTKITGAFVFSFFDSAGEDLDSEDRISNLTRYVYNSDGLIILVDPMEFKYVRDRLPASTRLPSAVADPIDIITRVSRIIRQENGISQKAKIKTPIAVTLSKVDALKGMIDDASPILRPPPSFGGYARRDSDAVSDEVQVLLKTWHTEHIVQIVEQDFQKFKYFGVSALGGAASASGEVGMIKPHRVTFPFEWLLYTHGLLKAADER